MSENVIEVRDIIRNFKLGQEEVKVLKGIDLDIKRGDYVAFMGPSGSGKSTLMNLLGCLDTPTAGTYRLNGTDVSSLSDDDLAIPFYRAVAPSPGWSVLSPGALPSFPHNRNIQFDFY